MLFTISFFFCSTHTRIHAIVTQLITLEMRKSLFNYFKQDFNNFAIQKRNSSHKNNQLDFESKHFRVEWKKMSRKKKSIWVVNRGKHSISLKRNIHIKSKYFMNMKNKKKIEELSAWILINLDFWNISILNKYDNNVQFN